MNTAPWNKFQPLYAIVNEVPRAALSLLQSGKLGVKWRRYHTHAAGEYSRAHLWLNKTGEKSVVMETSHAD
jgi:phage baseplate assembly protein gpV